MIDLRQTLPGRWLADRRIGIRSRILLNFAALFLLGTLALEGIGLFGLPALGIQGDIPATRERALQTLNSTADDRRLMLEQWLQDRRLDVAKLANHRAIQQDLEILSDVVARQRQRGSLDTAFWESYQRTATYQRFQNNLASFSDFANDIYAGVSFIDTESGDQIAGDRLAQIGRNFSGHLALIKARQYPNDEQIFFVTRPATGQVMLVFLHKLRESQSTPNAKLENLVMALGIRPEAIPLTDSEGVPGKTQKTLLIDQTQRLISRLRPGQSTTEPLQVIAERIDSRIAQLATRGGEGMVAELDHRGQPVLAAFRHIPLSAEEGWSLIVQQDEAEVIGQMIERLWQRIPLTLGILVLILLGVRWLAQRIARPIVDLAHTTQALEAGDLCARSTIRRRDEIGLLAHAFNAMAERVSAWHEALQETVNERTAQLQQTNQLYQLLGHSNQAIVQCENEHDLFVRICQDAVVLGGMKMAWIGEVDTHNQKILPVESFGDHDGFLNTLELSTTNDPSAEQCPVNRALSEGRPVWCQDFLEDLSTCSWHQQAIRNGWASMAALPLQRGGQIVGILALYAGTRDAFDPQVQELLQEMAVDIGFALEHYAGEAQRRVMEQSLRQNEARFHGIFSQVEDGIVLADFHTQLVESVNPAFLRMCGLTAEQATGRKVADFHAPEDLPRVIEAFAMLQENRKVSVENMPFLRHDGSTFNADIVASVIELEGRPLVCGVIRDITERERITDELKRHREHLEEIVRERTGELSAALEAARVADQTKDAFLANISHELRTPLNAIMGFAQLAHSTGTDPRQRDYLAKITTAARSLAEIINDLLDLSKIAAGHLEFESIAFSPASLVERCESMMSHQAAAKGLQLSTLIDPAIPASLIGDPHRIEQILLNLLSNAIKYTQEGRIELRIGIKEQNPERICLQAEVEDTGIGIDPRELARLFKPFSQVDASITRRYGGTGLGLAISKRLAEMMDGDISVKSRKGEGSTFRATFWLRLPEGNAMPIPAQQAPAPRKTVRFHDSRVLVAEDQTVNQLIIEELLRGVGIEAVIAHNGQEALDILERMPAKAFDLVLMDLQMPLLDGLSATRKIRQRPEHATLPIVALTAHSMEHEQQAAREAGMNDHLAKPFEMDQFYAALARWIPAAKQQIVQEGRPTGMPEGLPQIEGLDTAAGLTYFASKEARYRYWLGVFAERAGEEAAQIIADIAGGELSTAAERTHALKGRIGMLGMTALHVTASELNSLLLAGSSSASAAATLAARFGEEVGKMCRLLSKALAIAPAENNQHAAPTGSAGQLPEEERAKVMKLLERCDGASADAIADCLARYPHADCAQKLREALQFAQHFDYAAAARTLTP